MNAQDSAATRAGLHGAEPARPSDRAASRFMVSFSAAAVVTIGANLALREFPGLPVPVRVLLVVLSAPALVAMLVYGPRALRAMDELEQRIQHETLAYSFGVISLVLVVYGQIQTAFGLRPEPWTIVWPMMFVVYLACLMLVRRRYQ